MASTETHTNDSQHKPEQHHDDGGFLGLGNLVHEAWDGMKSGVKAVEHTAENAVSTGLHDLQIVGQGFETAGKAIGHEASDIYSDAKQFAKDHPTLTNIGIDVVSGVAAVGVGALTSFTGPGAFAAGALTGAAVNEGLHAALGQQVTLKNTALNVTSGMIDGVTGGLAGALEKTAATKLGEWGITSFIENGAARLGINDGAQYLSNLVVKGATDLHLNPEALAEMTARSARIAKMMGTGTDFVRSRLYQTVVGRGLYTTTSAAVESAIPGG